MPPSQHLSLPVATGTVLVTSSSWGLISYAVNAKLVSGSSNRKRRTRRPTPCRRGRSAAHRSRPSAAPERVHLTGHRRRFVDVGAVEADDLADPGWHRRNVIIPGGKPSRIASLPPFACSAANVKGSVGKFGTSQDREIALRVVGHHPRVDGFAVDLDGEGLTAGDEFLGRRIPDSAPPRTRCPPIRSRVIRPRILTTLAFAVATAGASTAVGPAPRRKPALADRWLLVMPTPRHRRRGGQHDSDQSCCQASFSAHALRIRTGDVCRDGTSSTMSGAQCAHRRNSLATAAELSGTLVIPVALPLVWGQAMQTSWASRDTIDMSEQHAHQAKSGAHDEH